MVESSYNYDRHESMDHWLFANSGNPGKSMPKQLKFVILMLVAISGACPGRALACDPPVKKTESLADLAAQVDLPNSQLGYSQNYLHSWVYFPEFVATDIKTGQEFNFKPERGVANVLVFIASWCVPCQQIIPDIKKLERTYSSIHTRFIYIFSQDTKQDIAGFVADYGLSNGIAADKDVLAKYHNPELPSVYLGDRHRCLTSRSIATTAKDLTKLGQTLRYLTAY